LHPQRASRSIELSGHETIVLKILHSALLSCLTLAPPPAGPEPPRRDGNWEVRVDVELDGDPTAIPSRTLTQCVSKDDAGDVKKALPHGADSMPAHCTASDHKVEGSRVSWSFSCDADSVHPLKGTGEIVYVDESHYAGTIRVEREGKTMTVKYAGTRLGDCPD